MSCKFKAYIGMVWSYWRDEYFWVRPDDDALRHRRRFDASDVLSPAAQRTLRWEKVCCMCIMSSTKHADSKARTTQSFTLAPYITTTQRRRHDVYVHIYARVHIWWILANNFCSWCHHIYLYTLSRRAVLTRCRRPTESSTSARGGELLREKKASASPGINVMMTTTRI